jgi:pimeloyl-ACP methyl ester carboxylesterase
VVKASKLFAPPTAVRTRRAYFDCKFGQLHVRTAFPVTGGFDEQVTLFCLHPLDASSRLFGRFLSELADVRSVYAPDLPGCGESDPSPSRKLADDAAAISDMADD